MWTTGAVGAEHRAVMCNGQVEAVAESTPRAAQIVRALNDDNRRRATARTLVLMRDRIEELKDSLQGWEVRDQLEAILRIGQEEQLELPVSGVVRAVINGERYTLGTGIEHRIFACEHPLKITVEEA
jgi:hypothetical protein